MTCEIFRILGLDSLLPDALGEKLATICPAKGGVYSVHTRVHVMPRLIGDPLFAYFSGKSSCRHEYWVP